MTKILPISEPIVTMFPGYAAPLAILCSHTDTDYFKEFGKKELELGFRTIDHRMYAAFYEHKEMMLNRIRYMHEKGCLDAWAEALYLEYQKLRDNAKILLNTILKANVRGQADESFLDKISNMLDEIRAEEKRILTQVFKITL